MNHQPFRDWLLSEEKLSAEQIAEMKEHLLSCESCRQTEAAWSEVESAFYKIPPVHPAPGFTDRWQAYLSEYLEHQEKRRGWIIIGVIVLCIISLLGVLIPQLWSLLQTPGPYLAAWFTRLFSLVSIYYTFQNLLRPFSGNIQYYAIVGMFFLVGLISFMSVIWLATYQKLFLARRIV